ncbi:MAG: hypothetical protein H6867_04330 [Rhodospirillales bacterium]|nr:hypothetical protein [Rhodospirillales bacterium]MCB9996377.1 hypothetical protein [Rhodospirillales bacterium]
MTATITKGQDSKNKLEPLLTGSIEDRFYQAVHDAPPLYHDVIKTGWADAKIVSGKADINLRRENGFHVSDGKVAYEIVLLHGDNVNDETLAKMMALQDKVVRHKMPHTENRIDYKTEEEVIAHYSGGGLGLGIFTASGDLIGQTMLSFKQPVTGPFEAKHQDSQATLSWLMVDKNFRENGLSDYLIERSVYIAKSSGMSQIQANIRLDNPGGLSKFSSWGFVVAGMGTNAKDGSTHMKAFCPTQQTLDYAAEDRSHTFALSSLQDNEQNTFFDSMIGQGLVAKWNSRTKWFTFHDPSPQKQLKVVASNPKPAGL